VQINKFVNISLQKLPEKLPGRLLFHSENLSKEPLIKEEFDTNHALARGK
jgi:hypothetical protein